MGARVTRCFSSSALTRCRTIDDPIAFNRVERAKTLSACHVAQSRRIDCGSAPRRDGAPPRSCQMKNGKMDHVDRSDDVSSKPAPKKGRASKGRALHAPRLPHAWPRGRAPRTSPQPCCPSLTAEVAPPSTDEEQVYLRQAKVGRGRSLKPGSDLNDGDACTRRRRL